MLPFSEAILTTTVTMLLATKMNLRYFATMLLLTEAMLANSRSVLLFMEAALIF